MTHHPVHVVSQCSLMPGWWLASGDQRRLTGSDRDVFMTMRYTNGSVYFTFTFYTLLIRLFSRKSALKLSVTLYTQQSSGCTTNCGRTLACYKCVSRKLCRSCESAVVLSRISTAVLKRSIDIDEFCPSVRLSRFNSYQYFYWHCHQS